MVVSSVYRRIPSLSEVLRVLEVKGSVATWYRTDAKANDKTFADQLLSRLPQRRLLIFDLGFFSFSQVAVALNQPKEPISVEMVFRGLYHFARAFLRGDSTDGVAYWVEHCKVLGLVKAKRRRHRDNVACSVDIWVASG